MKAATAMCWLFVLGSCIGYWGCGRDAPDVAGCMAIRSVPDEGPPSDAESWWREIREAKASMEYREYEDAAVYWLDTLKASHIALWRHLVSASDVDLRYLIGRFGVSGSQADFRLMFCDPYLTVYQGKFIERPLTKEDDGVSSGEFAVIRGKVARFQTEHFWRDRVALQRYCYALMWRGILPVADECRLPVSYTQDGLESQDDNEFWYNARNVLVFASVTGRLDLIRGVSPSQLREGFAQWRIWFLANRDWLVFGEQGMTWHVDRQATAYPPGAQLPHPFPDWNDPPVPGPVLFAYQAHVIAK